MLPSALGPAPAPAPGAPSPAPDPPADASANDPDPLPERPFLYGTTIIEEDCYSSLSRFFTNYKDADSDLETDTPKYYLALQRLHLMGSSFLNVCLSDLHSFDADLYLQTISYPQEIIMLMDVVASFYYKTVGEKMLQGIGGIGGGNGDGTSIDDDDASIGNVVKRIQVRPFGVRQKKKIRLLDPNDIDTLVCLSGMVTRLNEIVPDLRSATFECEECHSETYVRVERGFIREPRSCDRCPNPNPMVLRHNYSTFGNKQCVKLQETPESIPEGETPHSIVVHAYDSLVDVVRPGDRVEITGIYRAVERRKNQFKSSVDRLFETYIDVLHFQLAGTQGRSGTASRRPAEEEGTRSGTAAASGDVFGASVDDVALETIPNRQLSEELHLRDEDIRMFREYSRREDILDVLIRSVAPSIFGMDSIKTGILCQLFGGTNKNWPDMRIRGDLHILLMGDPGTSKSQLLLQVNKIAPRGIYTSGKGSSSVGLTAYVQKDSLTGEFILEGGALVLSDQGVCCIDEFDKMSQHARSMLHEVMEQQTVSIAKAGIVCSLNARTSVLAAANPVDSTYNDRKTFMQNVNLPPTLLSRFDMIFIVRDNTEYDRQLARHIISLYEEDEDEDVEMEDDDDQRLTLSMRDLTKYILYAKRTHNPLLSDEVGDDLVKIFLNMRKQTQGNREFRATPRQLESVIRMSEAFAKMHLRDAVTIDDVHKAYDVMKETAYFKQ